MVMIRPQLDATEFRAPPTATVICAAVGTSLLIPQDRVVLNPLLRLTASIPEQGAPSEVVWNKEHAPP